MFWKKKKPADDQQPAQQEFKDVEIPDLKKKKKERKGGAVAPGAGPGAAGVRVGGGAASAGSGGVGGAAGAGAVGSGAAGAAGAGLAGVGASAGAGAGGGLFSAIGALLAGKIGVALLAGAALAVAGLGVVGYKAWKQAQANMAKGGPDLGDISSSMRVRKRNADGSKSLAMAHQAGKGELKWDDPNAKTQAEGETADAAADDEEYEDVEEADGFSEEGMGENDKWASAGGANRMKNDFTGKLSSQLGGQSAFGSKSIFSGGTGFNQKKMQASAAMKNMGAAAGGSAGKGGPGGPSMSAARGQLGAMQRGKTPLRVRSINTRNMSASNALGQAKFAKGMSAAGATAGGTEAGATYAADAFDGQSTTGGGASGIGDGGGGFSGTETPTDIGGGGAPGGEGDSWSDDDDWSGTDYDPPTVNYPEDQSPDTGLATACQALILVACALIIAGSILVNIGRATPICSGGPLITAIGMALCGVAMGLGAVVGVLGGLMQDNPMSKAYIGIGVLLIAGAGAGMAGGGWGTLAIIMAALMALSSLAMMFMG